MRNEPGWMADFSNDGDESSKKRIPYRESDSRSASQEISAF
jgi:hypothetical protein